MQNEAKEILEQMNRVIVGKEDVTKKILMAFLSGGHVLLEDVPGVGKTTIALAFSHILGLDYRRIQFTSDTMPSDITGFSVYDRDGNSLRYVSGAAMTNLLLADEINRTSSRTQAALLEVMEEGNITIDGTTREVPKPFLVIATQNPAGSAGTQLLPSAQLDRFMIRLSVGYPDFQSQVEMLRSRHHENPLRQIKTVTDCERFMQMQEAVRNMTVSDVIYEYVVRLSEATRNHEQIRQGLSPRAMLALCSMAKAAAYIEGREYVIPSDVSGIFLEVSVHRILLNTRARMAETEKEEILREILEKEECPEMKEKIIETAGGKRQ